MIAALAALALGSTWTLQVDFRQVFGPDDVLVEREHWLWKVTSPHPEGWTVRLARLPIGTFVGREWVPPATPSFVEFRHATASAAGVLARLDAWDDLPARRLGSILQTLTNAKASGTGMEPVEGGSVKLRVTKNANSFMDVLVEYLEPGGFRWRGEAQVRTEDRAVERLDLSEPPRDPSDEVGIQQVVVQRLREASKNSG